MTEPDGNSAEAMAQRREIVDRYDLGRDPENEIPDWEDPDIPEYQNTDEWGFYRENGYEEKSQSERRKRDKIKNSREGKWHKMLDDWETVRQTELFKSRIYKGIPSSLRGRVWMRLLDVDEVMSENVGTYETMRSLGRQQSAHLRQIDLDVNRTFRDHEMFRYRYSVSQQKLLHVLAAYSVYNGEVGYCQGMSQIAAMILMFVPTDDEAFWTLSQLFTKGRHSMHGFFLPQFPKLHRFQAHLENIVKQLLPRVHKNFHRENLVYTLFTVKWFLQCFLDRTPFSLTIRLWDIYMFEGDRLLLAMAYNILKMHRKFLAKAPFEDIATFLQQDLAEDFRFPDDDVIKSLEICQEELRKAKLFDPGRTPSSELPQKPFGYYGQRPVVPLARSHLLQARLDQNQREPIEFIDSNPSANHIREANPSANQKQEPDLSTNQIQEPQLPANQNPDIIRPANHNRDSSLSTNEIQESVSVETGRLVDRLGNGGYRVSSDETAQTIDGGVIVDMRNEKSSSLTVDVGESTEKTSKPAKTSTERLPSTIESNSSSIDRTSSTSAETVLMGRPNAAGRFPNHSDGPMSKSEQFFTHDRNDLISTPKSATIYVRSFDDGQPNGILAAEKLVLRSDILTAEETSF